jgi:hypothetical protein
MKNRNVGKNFLQKRELHFLLPTIIIIIIIILNNFVLIFFYCSFIEKRHMLVPAFF